MYGSPKPLIRNQTKHLLNKLLEGIVLWMEFEIAEKEEKFWKTKIR